MSIDLKDVQDVYKDAGENIIFSTLMLKRDDLAHDQEIIANLAEHLPAFILSLIHRLIFFSIFGPATPQFHSNSCPKL